MNASKRLDLTALVIVQEKELFSNLVVLLQQNFKEINVIEQYSKANSNRHKIDSPVPDIVFCDIDFADSDPFELVSNLALDQSSFIFISSSNNPLLKAVQFASLNCLVKPIQKETFLGLVKKVLKKIKKRKTKESPINQNDKISLSTHKGYSIVRLADIVYINSSGNYCTISLVNQEKITITKLIGDFERILPEDRFPRIHQSFIVNTKYISQVSQEDGLQVVLQNGVQVPIARRRKKELFRLLGIRKNSNLK